MKYESSSTFIFSSGVLGCCVSLLFFTILPRVLFLGGGLVSAFSVVQVALLELLSLSVAYSKPSQDILSLIVDMLPLGIYSALNLGSRKDTVYNRDPLMLYLHTYLAGKL